MRERLNQNNAHRSVIDDEDSSLSSVSFLSPTHQDFGKKREKKRKIHKDSVTIERNKFVVMATVRDCYFACIHSIAT